MNGSWRWLERFKVLSCRARNCRELACAAPPCPEPSESSAAYVLRLKIQLLEVSPMIWRRVLVPASYTLEELHGVIQVAMGWQSLRMEDQLEPNGEQPYPVCTGGAHSCRPEDCGGPEGYDERRREAIGFGAMNDFATVAELIEEALLSGKQDLLKDPYTLWGLEQAVDRMKARQPFLRDGFSRREVNARFRRAEHHVLMHQQS
jgi:Plasmid pRiA4b ORF-3-like protein